jgi:septal ring factor EnvC (AmiA/AmiB activator)
MNNLLFTALIITLLYYFFYYLPSQKKLANPPLKHNQSTQTEALASRITDYEPGAISGPVAIPDPEQIKKLQEDIQQKESTIIGLNDSYHQLETKKNQELDNLKKQINTITSQLTQLQSKQNTDKKELASTLDNLIKDIQDLNQEL